MAMASRIARGKVRLGSFVSSAMLVDETFIGGKESLEEQRLEAEKGEEGEEGAPHRGAPAGRVYRG